MWCSMPKHTAACACSGSSTARRAGTQHSIFNYYIITRIILLDRSVSLAFIGYSNNIIIHNCKPHQSKAMHFGNCFWALTLQNPELRKMHLKLNL